MGPLAIEPIGLVGFVVFACFKLIIQMRLERRFHVFDLTLRDQTVLDQPLCIQAKRGFMRFNLLVHDGVCEHRFIPLVMTKAAVTNEVDDDVFVKLLTKLCRNFCSVYNRLWIIAIHMKNWRFNNQRVVRRIRRRTAEVWCSRETDLVVHNDMHGATSFVTTQTRQRETLCDHALAREGCIAMQKDRHNFGAIRVV